MFTFSSALTQATLVKRYKRFLADVIMPSGEQITVHCPNTGAMTGCCDPHSIIYLSTSNNPKRKYRYTWEYATDQFGNKICINTNNANKVVLAALKAHRLTEVSQYSHILPEQKVNNSRIDFLLQEDGISDCYLEVKSVTLAEGSTGMFPDTVTTRGQKHCYELAQLSQEGIKAVLLFCIMREAISEFKIAESIDPDYAKAVKYAQTQGVEVVCYGCKLDMDGIQIMQPISILF
jgi:sugar fermentation stimulation protein A